MNNKSCLVIAGPTAVGKTSLAITLAEHFNTQIISADSRQCYKELNIGVAKPSSTALGKVKHYFIDSHSINEDVNAKIFETYALKAVDTIFLKHVIAIMVGGTGLYIKAFCEGIDEISVVDNDIKKNINSNFQTSGIEWLQNEIEKNDPLYFSRGEILNPQRLMRALEVKLSTGKSIIEFQTQEKKKRHFNIIKIGLELPKEQLHQNINNRVDEMMRNGLLEEVRRLYPYRHLSALQTVGYKELFDHLELKMSLDEAIKKIKTNTWQYAKRQMTWFKKDREIKWVSPTNSLSFFKENLEGFLK